MLFINQDNPDNQQKSHEEYLKKLRMLLGGDLHNWRLMFQREQHYLKWYKHMHKDQQVRKLFHQFCKAGDAPAFAVCPLWH